MGLLTQAGFIAITAIQSGQSCDKVFKETAYLAYPASRLENTYMNKLAASACSTENPDIIWSIVSTETNFRFRIIRINNQKKVLKGKEAITYLNKLKRNGRLENVDIGAMQLNWYWHRAPFKRDPLKMLDPAEQVNYLVRHFKPTLKKLCKDQWVGCYHNPKNGKRARIYRKSIAQSKNLLERKLKEFMDTRPDYLGIPTRALSMMMEPNSHFKPNMARNKHGVKGLAYRRRTALSRSSSEDVALLGLS